MLRIVSEPIVLTTKQFDYQERARIYIPDPSKAPPGVQTHVGPRGGIWFDSSTVPARQGYTPTKRPKEPKGKAPKKPKAEKPAKREIGQPIASPGDLPTNIQREAPDIQAQYTKIFNDVLAKGGSEADAMAAAKVAIPDRTGKQPKEPAAPKRQVGSPFAGGEDPNLPRTIQQESPQIRSQWVKAFNDVLSKSGSEADAIHAANLTLPLRTNPKAPASRGPQQPKPPRTTTSRKDMTMSPEENEPQPGRAMICLYLDPTIADILAIIPTIEAAQAGIELEAPEDLHITLAYYPMVQPGERDALIARAATLAQNSSPQTKVEGIAQFFSGPDDPTPNVLLVDPASLSTFHDYCCYTGTPGEPRPSMSHGFIPHITLAYTPPGTSIQFSPPAVPPLRFSALSVVFDNEERHDFRFRYDADAMIYRERKRKVDEEGAGGDPSESPQPNAMTQPQDEDTENAKDMLALTDPQTDSIASDQPLEKGGRRLRTSWREELAKASSIIRRLTSWADYEDEENEDEGEEMDGLKAVIKSFEEHPSFTVFKDATGENRWLSFSSNGFEDREGEIVATEALEKAVAEADRTGKRGELRLFHIKNAPIGDCDFQAIQGRFLIESGTFRDTELARKSLGYFAETKDVLGTSIGFRHPVEKFDGKVYHEIVEIVERSVCPHAYVANPWTAFTTIKEEPMDAVKSSWLEKVAGPELALTIIKQADEATKNLESSVSFKENTELTGALEVVKSVIATAPQETRDAYAALLTSLVTTKEQEAPAPSPEPAAATPTEFDSAAFLAKITELIAPIADAAKTSAEAVEAVAKDVKDLGDRMKSLENDATAEKARRGNEPRGASMFRATENGPVVDENKAKELLEASQPASSPVADYVKDLVTGRGVIGS